MCTASKNKALSSLMLLPLDFTPGPKDILCGRGNVFSNHEGNQYFGKIIRSSLRKYKEALNRREKIRVVDQILQEIKSSGVRFAKIDSKTKKWYELNNVQAHQKIGHAIRDTIRLLKDKSSNSNDIKRQPNLSMRKRYSRPATLPEQMQLPSDIRRKKIEKFRRDSFNKSKFYEAWVYSQKNPKQSRHSERSSSMGPLFLKDEYPEETFDFSARSFFGELRITSQ